MMMNPTDSIIIFISIIFFVLIHLHDIIQLKLQIIAGIDDNVRYGIPFVTDIIWKYKGLLGWN